MESNIMNRLHLSKDAHQTASAARQSLERLIREHKTIIRKPHKVGPPWASTSQCQLVYLKREATLLYAALAAGHGKTHCADWEERLGRLRNRAARGYPMSANETLVLELFETPTPMGTAQPSEASASPAGG
jgi:hypothetical protein